MTLFLHELRRGITALLIWTLIIAAMVLICVLIFPEMSLDMEDVGSMFAGMGSFTDAFGMDRLNIGTLTGFYGIECSNILGICGGIFAAILGMSALAEEEKNRTAEFLLTHPVSRMSVMTSKIVSGLLQIFILNLITFLTAEMAFLIIGDKPDTGSFLLMHLAYLLLQFELFLVCFGISAFLKRGAVAIGAGIALLAYFINILGNLTEKAEIAKYFTPYSYAEPADIVSNGTLSWRYVLIGVAAAAVFLSAGILRYLKKDIRS